MANKANPPPQLRIPRAFQKDAEVRDFISVLIRTIFFLWKKLGGGADLIADLEGDSNSLDLVNAAQIEELKQSMQGEQQNLQAQIEELRQSIQIKSSLNINQDEQVINNIIVSDLEFLDRNFTGEGEKITSSQSTDYTTQNSEVVICTDVLTITLNDEPDNYENVVVIRTNGAVTIDGNGKNVLGAASVIIGTYYSSFNLMYFLDSDEWLAI